MLHPLFTLLPSPLLSSLLSSWSWLVALQGVYVLDFEQNFSGYVRLTLPAPVPAGLTITLRHAEILQHPP